MRAALFALAALCAPVVLAVPHGDNGHRHLHGAAARRDVDYVTDVVTVTASNAVVWVDQFNSVISTEYHGAVVPTSIPASTDDSSSAAVPTVDPAIDSDASSSAAVASTPPAPPAAASSDPAPPAAAAPTADPATQAPPAPPADTPSQAPPAQNAVQESNDADAGKAAQDSNNADNARVASGMGIDYELINGGSQCAPQSQLNSDFGFLKSQGFGRIRFYDVGCDLSVATAAAAAAGMSVTLGLNTIGNVVGDLGKVVGFLKGNWGPVDTVVIGNEVVNQGGSVGAVVAALTTAQGVLAAAGYTKDIVAVDTYTMHEAHPEICAASSYCAVNCHAFFDGNTLPENAGQFVAGMASKIAGMQSGKSVVITESGWPHQGNPNGVAIPSIQNQQTAIESIKSAFAGNPSGLFLFQAYDATYKAPGSLGVEQFFGIYGH